MMTGTQLVLLAMYSTVNVVGPAGNHLQPQSLPLVICLLIGAASLTCWQVYEMTRMPRRASQSGPKFTPMRRHYSGPALRRH